MNGLVEAMRLVFVPRHPRPPEFNQTCEWVHPAYAARRIDIRFNPVPCPRTRSGYAHRISFPLKNGYMVPEVTVYG